MNGSVEMSQRVADAVSTLGIGDWNTFEPPERCAWLILVLRLLEDRPEWFPHGKWATIQHIEYQVLSEAVDTANKIETGSL